MKETSITNFLQSLVKTVKEDNTFCFIDSYENLKYENIENFIWIGTHNRIGITDCHYEVIFHETDTGYVKYPSVEVHFEGMYFKDFQEISLPDYLKYMTWTCNSECLKFKRKRRIVYCNEKKINIKKKEDAIRQVLGLLDNLHQAIGQKLEQLLYKISERERRQIMIKFSQIMEKYCLAQNCQKHVICLKDIILLK